MKITFNGHSQTNREVELTEKQLGEIFESMRQSFMDHIEFTTVFNRNYSYMDAGDRVVYSVCNAHGVDVEYKKDRVAFFKAVLDNMKNPYQ